MDDDCDLSHNDRNVAVMEVLFEKVMFQSWPEGSKRASHVLVDLNAEKSILEQTVGAKARRQEWT